MPSPLVLMDRKGPPIRSRDVPGREAEPGGQAAAALLLLGDLVQALQGRAARARRPREERQGPGDRRHGREHRRARYVLQDLEDPLPPDNRDRCVPEGVPLLRRQRPADLRAGRRRGLRAEPHRGLRPRAGARGPRLERGRGSDARRRNGLCSVHDPNVPRPVRGRPAHAARRRLLPCRARRRAQAHAHLRRRPRLGRARGPARRGPRRARRQRAHLPSREGDGDGAREVQGEVRRRPRATSSWRRPRLVPRTAPTASTTSSSSASTTASASSARSTGSWSSSASAGIPR